LQPLPKAELHVHLEGTAPPELIQRIAARNGVPLPERLLGGDGRFRYTDFLDFLRTYDLSASVIRTRQDYRDITYEYLSDCAAGGAIYVDSMDAGALPTLASNELAVIDATTIAGRVAPIRGRQRGAADAWRGLNSSHSDLRSVGKGARDRPRSRGPSDEEQRCLAPSNSRARRCLAPSAHPPRAPSARRLFSFSSRRPPGRFRTRTTCT